MSPKSEKLLQRIQNIQKFVAARASREPAFGAVAGKLGKLAESLGREKLNIKIVSRFPALAQGLQRLVNTRDSLTSLYQIKTATLPDRPQEAAQTSTASLILTSASPTGEQQTRYPLPANQKVVIGRSSGCQIMIPEDFRFVHRNHAEVLPLENSSSGNRGSGWVIRDLNSRNGTYINGDRLQGEVHVLQPGDRINLGASNSSTSSAELIFECQGKAPVNQENQLDQFPSDCDVLCLVANATQNLSEEEKRLIGQGSQGQTLKSIIVLDTSAASDGDKIVEANLKAVKTWCQKYSQGLAMVSLHLRPFYHPNAQGNELSLQPEINQFSELLENIANCESDEYLREQAKKQLIAEFTIIDRVYSEKLADLNKEIQQQQEALAGRTLDELSEQLKQAFKQVNEDKEKTFRQVRLDISQSKVALVDRFSKNSLMYKIKQSVDELKLEVTKEEGEIYLRLRSASMGKAESINDYMLRLCYNELGKWIDEEWGRTCHNYAEGGLTGFFQRNETTLTSLPTIEVTNFSFQPSQNLDVSKCLQESMVEFKTHLSYKESSPVGDLISITGSIGLSMLMANPMPFLMGGLGLLTRKVFQEQAQAAKREQLAENMRVSLYNHYQALAQNLVEKLVTKLVLALQAEEQRSKEALDKINAQLTELLAINKRLNECNAQRTSLNAEKAELLKLLKGG